MDDFNLWVGACTMEQLTCDFESSSCGWNDDKLPPLEWERVAAHDGGESVGYDHTTSSAEGKIVLLFYDLFNKRNM